MHQDSAKHHFSRCFRGMFESLWPYLFRCFYNEEQRNYWNSLLFLCAAVGHLLEAFRKRQIFRNAARK